MAVGTALWVWEEEHPLRLSRRLLDGQVGVPAIFGRGPSFWKVSTGVPGGHFPRWETAGAP